MFLTTLIVLTTLLPRIDAGFEAVRGLLARPSFAAAERMADTGPRFVAEERSVSNWRDEAGGALRPGSLALVVRYAFAEPAFVARCVKLNNYWCIKSARWSGEIGADAEGHTGFATAADGADAAAQLLRRYYRAFGRRTALGIVRRWAPAECGLPASAGRVGAVAAGLATRGLGRTLRGRYLARHSKGGGPRRALARTGGPLRVQPWSPLSRLSAPAKHVRAPASTLLVRPSEIVAKPSVMLRKPSVLLVEPSVLLKAPAAAPRSGRIVASARLQERFVAESAALPPIAAGLPNIPLLDLSVPAPFCGTDEVRIRNYATRIAQSVGLKIEDDLKLFGTDGEPTSNLGPVLLAMSGVELGTLRAGPALVEAAIARLKATAVAAER